MLCDLLTARRIGWRCTGTPKGGHASLKDYGYVIQVPVVVNTNTAQVLVVTEIPLTPPAFKIHEIDKLIEIDDCAATCDKVIINGRLIKSECARLDAAPHAKRRIRRPRIACGGGDSPWPPLPPTRPVTACWRHCDGWKR